MGTMADTAILPYNPATILNLFNNAISVQETRKVIQVRGVYQQGKGANYNGYFYDTIRDESSDAYLTLLVPALIRNQLEVNKTILFYGYITRRVVNSGGRIEIQITITDLVEQTHNKHSEEEWKTIELLQKKVTAGYRDVTSFIKTKIIHNEPFRIVIIIGKTGIIDSDIKHQQRESIARYSIHYERVSLTSEADILGAIKKFDNENTDILVVARGGGENLDIFNRPAIAERCISLTPYFLTAIGHKEDNTLLQKVADKAFIVPAELGQFLNETYNQTVEELENSKAKLVETITKQLKANYDKQIINLNEKIATLEELKKKAGEDMKNAYDERINTLQTQIKTMGQNHEKQVAQIGQLQSQKLALLEKQVAFLSQQNTSKDSQIVSYKQQVSSLRNQQPSVNWVALIIAVIVGLIIGLAMR